jgi:hypothetical protein
MPGKLILSLLLAAHVLGPFVPPVPALSAADELDYWTTHATVKVRPDDPPRARTLATIAAARNEFESFQVVLHSDRDIHEIDVEVSSLTGEQGARIDAGHLTVYRVDSIDIEVPSSRQSQPGEWPDPLVPRVDRYFGERRNAFPFSIRGGRNQPIWIEVYVPIDARPGLYEGEATVTVAGEIAAVVPLRLEVWPFTLPSTASLPTSFGFSGLTALRQHDGDLVEVSRLYARAALLHRISLHGGSWRTPDVVRIGRGFRLDWDGYDAEMGGFLDGTVLGAGDPLPGARVTSVDLRTPGSLADVEERLAYWRAWAEHFRDKGWLDRLFFYLFDEPQGEEDYARILELGRELRRADPEIRTLLTEQVVPSLLDVVDIWVPLINCVHAKPDFAPWCEGSASVAEAPDAGTFWAYQSCASHGCNIVGGDYFDGWPTYVIDAPAVGNRVMQWIAWRYRIEGELYYNTVEGYGGGGNPWRDPRLYGGNGEGTLFYPGTPERIGGRREIPIESLRLKLIRDGLEDYEYLVLLAAAGDREYADRQAGTVAATPFGWDSNPEILLGARRRLADRIVRLQGANAASTLLRSAGAAPAAATPAARR